MPRAIDDTRIRAWRGLMHVHARIMEALDAALQERHGISITWYQVLVELRLAGGALRMHHLAEVATLSRSATTRLVDQIERAGLVERRVCPSDRRGVEVALTEAGSDLQRRAAPAAIRVVRDQLWSRLDDDQAATLAAILEAVADPA